MCKSIGVGFLPFYLIDLINTASGITLTVNEGIKQKNEQMNK